MNKKLAELTIHKSADYYNKVVKALEDAGFVIVLDVETTTERYYIVAKSEEEQNDTNNFMESQSLSEHL